MENKIFTKCIICNKSTDLTYEHIIPESLGNKEIGEKFVCKKCNSEMGNKIDKKLINDPLIGVYRNMYNIVGKTGSLPEIKGILKYNGAEVSLKNGKIKYVPNMVEKENGVFEIRANTLEEAKKMVETKCKRQNKDDCTVDYKIQSENIKNPQFVSENIIGDMEFIGKDLELA
jgi:uncharacterized protein YlaI